MNLWPEKSSWRCTCDIKSVIRVVRFKSPVGGIDLEVRLDGQVALLTDLQYGIYSLISEWVKYPMRSWISEDESLWPKHLNTSTYYELRHMVKLYESDFKPWLLLDWDIRIKSLYTYGIHSVMVWNDPIHSFSIVIRCEPCDWLGVTHILLDSSQLPFETNLKSRA